MQTVPSASNYENPSRAVHLAEPAMFDVEEQVINADETSGASVSYAAKQPVGAAEHFADVVNETDSVVDKSRRTVDDSAGWCGR